VQGDEPKLFRQIAPSAKRRFMLCGNIESPPGLIITFKGPQELCSEKGRVMLANLEGSRVVCRGGSQVEMVELDVQLPAIGS
jgi:hypothetical protein